MTNRIIPCILAATLTLAQSAFPHGEPTKAKLLKAQLVKAYEPCTAPNTTTSAGAPACAPQTPSDAECQFGEKGGVGTFQATAKAGGISARVALKGLDTGCEGRTLTAVVSVRATSEDCAFSACTAEFVDLPLGTCSVRRGKCTIKGATAAGIFVPENETQLELQGCGIQNGSLRTFSCGFFIP